MPESVQVTTEPCASPTCPTCGRPVPKKGDLFSSIGDFFGNAWNKAINPAIGFIWHVVGGAVTGTILPTVGQSIMDGKFSPANATSTVISGLVLAIVGYAQHCNNQNVATLAATVTPDQLANVDAKLVNAVTSLGKKS
jgi:hypothetical protein